MPEKAPGFTILDHEPFNGGPTLDLLGASLITPTELFFVRNHAPVPAINPAEYHLRIGGLVRQVQKFSLDDLRNNFQSHCVVVTMQCAGNRRRELLEVAPIPDEIIWDTEAISTAEWTGVSLRDVLLAAGVRDSVQHVEFIGLDQIEKDGKTIGFGGSIPLARAMHPDVLLAYEMNGEVLPPEHGYPIRAIVPGYIGARSVKWVGEINLLDDPSDNYYQARAYRMYPPNMTKETADWRHGIMLGELPVNSMITTPLDEQTLPAGEITLKGFAMTGVGKLIERVDISTDGGKSWQTAELIANEMHPWAWRLWQITLKLEPGEYQLVCRAWDSAVNTQPESVSSVWNFKGYMNNAWHRIKVRVE